MDEVRPKVTRSDKESNCTPISESTLSNLAKKPSKKSHTSPIETRIARVLRSPITPKTTAIHPTNKFASVKKFGIKFNIFTI